MKMNSRLSHMKKQVKITKLFRKGAKSKQPDDECMELEQEVQELEQRLKEKQNELFQILRNNCRQTRSSPKNINLVTGDEEEIRVKASLESIKRNIELMAMLTGMEVQSFVEGDHCCVVYHMQHKSPTLVKHGLKIESHPDGYKITKSNMPLGFKLKTIVETFDNIMTHDCLCTIRRALVAYYDRRAQCEDLQKLLNIEANIFKVLDGSHVEIEFSAQRHDDDEEDYVNVTLILDYKIDDIRPKSFCLLENGLPDDVSEVLREQCAVFKKKPLCKAFKQAFMDNIGPYRLVPKHGPTLEEYQKRPPKRFRPNKKNYNNDDTFLLEDCSDQGEDENSE